ncbi:TPA: isoleucine--tRNA ligase [Candidatus Berkelbacteria bacterium]|uniref:Isoleucine--tRNA ligase n=1 Tax=Berkelbacteria bacterium GW2011_GWE1_39_12 TaxID=1618337 RepID=A0A0G4B2T4_9BACT|nr:MAG: isoleucyl-tRNA synthetase, isoleucyl-tRNA synthetase [Berkelbacteria bacterium GW2011_GWE1_39_12]HBO60457.1 isoleucine--tRNA ligase [Candidatus Berkelbacteria bacterium]
MSYKKIDSQVKLPEIENEILNFWQENDTFKKSIENRKGSPIFSFYDGPPFATGTPHYGHLVQSVAKDAVPRFFTMKGFQVDRIWGWDCHGLPIENIAEQELGITHKKEIEDLGIDKFNNICRDKVLGYVDEWEKIIPKLGRWVDMKNAYRTMDFSYMESVWWVFKELYDKDLVYEGYRSMHICPRCETTLSQSEVTEGYKTIKDLSATAKFELIDEQGTFVLAWTTTPWTLIANVALAVGKDIEYVKVQSQNEDTGESEKYILAKNRLADVFKDREFEKLEDFPGEELIGQKYDPLYRDYKDLEIENSNNGWKIVDAPFVTTEEGTGIVHIAPAFGEDDLNLGKKKNLPFVQHIGMDGIIKPEVKQFAGMHVKHPEDVQKTDVEIIKNLASRNLLFSKEKYEHSYPHCWRCETPLLNYATSSWFVNVIKVKPDLLNLAKEINWSPKHIKEGRFGKWLEGARDWSISRQRYWASVIPLWRCSAEHGGCGEIKVFGSMDDLRKETNQKITKISFVRHGESEKNVLKISSHSLDKFPLTEKGKVQAENGADKLKDIDLIISSPVLRTKQTAEIINKKLQTELIFDDRITENQFGSWNDTSKEELLKEDESYKSYKALKTLEERFNCKFGTTGENRQEVVDRIENFLKEIAKKYAGKNILIVGHGGTNASMNKILNDCKLDEYFDREDFDHNGVQTFYVDENAQIVDLHKDKIDNFTINCDKCGKEAHRVPDVLDTWFDSGSMPYAQIHYPFENKEKFANYFPANFIAEAQDQTRAWFYYLHLIATSIKKSVAYKNVIVSGIVLAEDGKKMSKRLKNYPDPVEVLDRYGADVLRMYLLSSQILQAENLNFSEKDLDQFSKGFFRMLWNSYSFFTLYANIDNFKAKENSELSAKSENILDKWILSELNQLIKDVNANMEKYELTKAARLFVPFVDNLSNWYIRRSRKRFQKQGNAEDKNNAYQTLHTVLVELSKTLAPFMPFTTEEIFKNLTSRESVHLENFPVANEDIINKGINEKMSETRVIIEQGLAARAALGPKYKVRQPLGYLKYGGKKLDEEFEKIIEDEVNVKEVVFTGYKEIEIDQEITPELQDEGMKNDIVRAIQDLRKKSGYSPDDLVELFADGNLGIIDLIKKFKDEIKNETKLTDIKFERREVDQSIDIKLNNDDLWIGVKK